MDADIEGFKKRARRRHRLSLGIFGLIVASMGGVVIYQGLQPKYSFLRGLKPAFAGNPNERISTSSHVRMPLYVEVYSFAGSFEQWRAKVEPEMRIAGANLSSRFERTATDATSPKVAIWSIGPSVPELFQGQSVYMVEGYEYGRAATPLTPTERDGIISIIVSEPVKPTFVTRVKDWFKSLTKGV